MSETATQPKPRRAWLALIPVLLFAALAVVFLLQLLSGRDAATVPSALIGQPAPQTALPALDGSDVPALTSAALKGDVTLVNVWASWCAPCRQEHPELLALAKDGGIHISGINYKDDPENARRFLGELGNPFAAIGVDRNGRTAINWGVYGVPETYVVDAQGIIRYRHVGPLTPESVTNTLLPEIAKARGG